MWDSCTVTEDKDLYFFLLHLVFTSKLLLHQSKNPEELISCDELTLDTNGFYLSGWLQRHQSLSLSKMLSARFWPSWYFHDVNCHH